MRSLLFSGWPGQDRLERSLSSSIWPPREDILNYCQRRAVARPGSLAQIIKCTIPPVTTILSSSQSDNVKLLLENCWDYDRYPIVTWHSTDIHLTFWHSPDHLNIIWPPLINFTRRYNRSWEMTLSLTNKCFGCIGGHSTGMLYVGAWEAEASSWIESGKWRRHFTERSSFTWVHVLRVSEDPPLCPVPVLLGAWAQERDGIWNIYLGFME